MTIFKTIQKLALCATAATGAIAIASPASALNIVLHADTSFANQPNGAAALQAFQVAAGYWNTTLTNNTTLNFNVSYAALGANIIGSTGSSRADVAVSDVYSALAHNSATALDSVAVANLHPLTAAGGLGYRRPGPVTPTAPGSSNGLGLNTAAGSIYDNDDTFDNTALYGNTANLKALGFTHDIYGNALATTDASITFSSNFAFDFNPSDGISVGTEDFVAVAIHEMGHALGFVSGTDFYDQYGGDPSGVGKSGPSFAVGNTIDWDTQDVESVLDLYRYSTNGASNSGFDPVTGKRYLQLDPNRGAAFSVDGVNFFNAGNTANGGYANFSTGAYTGDGSQASHWKDMPGYSDANDCFVSNVEIGIMDPTSGYCQMGYVTDNDLAAMDAIGYNLNLDTLNNTGYNISTGQIFQQLAGGVPEPATWAMMISGFGLVGAAARRSRTKGSVSYS